MALPKAFKSLTRLVLMTLPLIPGYNLLDATGAEVGDQFHNIRFTDEQGNQRQLDELRGKVVTIKFWGSWCGTCRKQFPKQQAIYDQLKSENDVEVVTISFADPLKTSKAWTDSIGYDVPLYHGSNLGIIKTADGPPFQPLGTPYNLGLDRNGVIQNKWVGRQGGVTADMVRALL